MGTWYRTLLSSVAQSPGSSLIEGTAGAIPVSLSKSRCLFPASAHTKVWNLDEAEPALKQDAGQHGSPLHTGEWGSFVGESLVLHDALYSP